MQKSWRKEDRLLPHSSFLGTADLKELAARRAKIGVHAVSAGGDPSRHRPVPCRLLRFEKLDARVVAGDRIESGSFSWVLKGISALGGERTSGFEL